MTTIPPAELVFFTVLNIREFGDWDGCATIEVARSPRGWVVGAGPTRYAGTRETAFWVTPHGRRRVFRSAGLAKAAVERERSGESIHWCRKLRLQRVFHRQRSF